MTSGKVSRRRDRELARNQPNLSASVSYSRSEFFSSVVPSSNELRQIEELVPGAAKQILDNFDKQSNHRRSLEAKALNGEVWGSHTGRACALIISLVVLILGYKLIMANHDWAGGSMIGVDVASLAGIFIYGSSSRSKERQLKNEQRQQ